MGADPEPAGRGGAESLGIPVQDAAGRVSATPHPNDQATISKELYLKLPSLRPLSTPFLLVGHRSRQHAKDTRPWRPEHAQPCLLFAVMLSWVASSGGQRAGPAGQRGAQTHSLLSSLAEVAWFSSNGLLRAGYPAVGLSPVQ